MSRHLEPWTPPPPRTPRPQVPASGLEGPVDAGPLGERLIRATLESLRRNGLEATTSREIARIAGTYLQAITYHFGSKDELVAEALVRAIQTWIGPARTILRSKNEDPAARMIAAVQSLQTAFNRAKPLMPVYVEALLHTRTNDRIRARVRHIMRELRKLLVDQMAELRDARFLPSWLEPEPMATLLLSTADGLALHATIDPKSIDHEAVAGQVVQLLLSARAQP
jgi:AcrR family transcriptional regulator